MKSKMAGLYSGEEQLLSLPTKYISRLLAEIDDLAEVKLTLFCLWALGQKEGNYRYLRYAEFQHDDSLMRGISQTDDTRSTEAVLDEAIGKAVARGTLLEAQIEINEQKQRLFLLNDERGQAVHRQMLSGDWLPSASDEIEILPVRPTLYGLYEANIGVLTPMIADAIQDAEATYPRGWIEDAIRYAVERNARNWRYVRKVLESWQREGRRNEEAGRHHERHKRYTTGEWQNFIER